MILDLIITGANVYLQYSFYTKIYNHHAIIRDNLLPNYNEVEKTMLFFSFLMWLKFLVYLKLTKSFGYVIKIIEIIIKDLFHFFLIFIIIILAFAVLCYDLFDGSHEKFKTFPITLGTLLEITYGQVFFKGFTSNQTLAAVIITIFSIISIVILLNLLIAILSNAYSIINQRSNVENANILYENYLLRKPNKYYSALIALPPPFNVLTIFFSPFVILKKSSTLNKTFMMIGFSFFLPFYLIIYLFINIFLIIPLCWIKYILFILINVVFRQKSFKSVIFLFFWIALGLIKLLYLLFTNDFYYFIKSVFYSSSNRDKLDEISLMEISLIKKKALLLSQKNQYTTYDELKESIKNELNAMNNDQSNMNSENFNFFSNGNEENFSKKFKLNKIFQDYSSSKISSEKNMRNREKKFVKELEIDKIEVFSFLKQFEGVNGKILLERLIEILNMIPFCKKFTMQKLNKKQEEKLVSNIQIVDIMAVEKTVLNLLSEHFYLNEINDEIRGQNFKNKLILQEKEEEQKSIENSFDDEILFKLIEKAS